MAGDLLSVLTGLALLTLGAQHLLVMYRGDRKWDDRSPKSHVIEDAETVQEEAIYWTVGGISLGIFLTGVWVTIVFGVKVITSL